MAQEFNMPLPELEANKIETEEKELTRLNLKDDVNILHIIKTRKN